MARGMSVSVVEWVNTTIPSIALQSLIDSVDKQEARVAAEQSVRSGGIAPDLRFVSVDGTHGTAADIRSAGSRVMLDWNYINEAAIRTIEYLRLNGPERSGRWKRSIVALVNGTEQSVDQPIPADVEQVTIVVTVPYARKLEVGRTKSGRAFSIQVPQHYIESAVTRLRSEMRDLATFEFTYISLAGAHTLTSPAGLHRRNWRHGHAELSTSPRREGEVTYPAIIIDEIQAVG